MATCAELATRLAQAETALHALETGSKVERVQYGEKLVSYTPASIDQLRRYVARLTDDVARCSGSSAARRRAFGVIPLG